MVGLQRPQPVVLTDEDGDAYSSANPAPMQIQNANGATYSVFGTAYAGYATPTDMMVLKGSATKIVRVQTFLMAIGSTSAVLSTVSFIKRSVANSGGTATQPTVNKLDSNDAAATAVVDLYSAGPTPGAGVTLFNQVSLTAVLTSAPTSFNILNAYNVNSIATGKPIVLRGVAESLAFNWGGAVLPAGFVANYLAAWTESDA